MACSVCKKPKAEKNKSFCSNVCKNRANRKPVEPKAKDRPKNAYQMMMEGLSEARRRGWEIVPFLREMSAHLGYKPKEYGP